MKSHLNFCLFIMFISLGFINSPATSAQVIGYGEITTLSDPRRIETFFKEALSHAEVSAEETLVVLDWDNTITKKNGSDRGRKGIGNLMNILIEQELHSLVITNRLHGLTKYAAAKFDRNTNWEGNEDAFLRDFASSMLSTLSSDLSKNFNNALTQLPFSPCRLNHDSEIAEFPTEKEVFYLVDNIFFAGSPLPGNSNKGIALRMLLDSSTIEKANTPKLIIFMDDIKDNLLSVGESFEDRPEKVLLLFIDHPESRSRNQLQTVNDRLEAYPKINILSSVHIEMRRSSFFSNFSSEDEDSADDDSVLDDNSWGWILNWRTLWRSLFGY